MDVHLDPPAEAPTLWRVAAFGRQRTAAGRLYWWENRPRRPTDMAVFQATLEGGILYRDTAGPRAVRPGSLLLFAYGEDSAYGSPQPLEEPYRCAWVTVQGAGLIEHLATFRRRHGSVRDVGLDHPLLTGIDDLITLAQPQRSAQATTMAAAVHSFVMHLFNHAETHRMQRLSPVEQAIEHLLRQPHAPLTLEQIAAKFGCSREHLGRAFRDRVGQPPGRYLAQARRGRALRLLRETDLPLSAVAAQSGFPTPHTLARQIRQATGQAPTTLRTRHG